MIQLILSIRDSKSEMFLSPFVVPTLGVAYRDIGVQLSKGGSEQNPLAMFPGDFAVWQLGTFDTDTGVVDSVGYPVRLVEVSSLIVPRDKEVGGLLD